MIDSTSAFGQWVYMTLELATKFLTKSVECVNHRWATLLVDFILALGRCGTWPWSIWCLVLIRYLISPSMLQSLADCSTGTPLYLLHLATVSNVFSRVHTIPQVLICKPCNHSSAQLLLPLQLAVQLADQLAKLCSWRTWKPLQLLYTFQSKQLLYAFRSRHLLYAFHSRLHGSVC